jgi:hypothetical protein
MGIIKNTLKKEIDRNNLQRINNTVGTILEYDIKTNTATIEYENPNGEGYLYSKNVQITETLGGVTGAGISINQLCTLNFIGNNINKPVITGVLDNNYNYKTCSDQGAYIISNAIKNCELPDKITPMVNNWLDESNENKLKYSTNTGDFISKDLELSMFEILDTINKYSVTEQGITNLDTKSTIKFKDNGDIDIFVNNNTGIRIDANTQTINIYGLNILFNGKPINSLS